MFIAYVIKSVHHDYYYKEHTGNIEKRLEQHNAGMTRSIKAYLPFFVIYYEEFETEIEAIKREKYFKTAAGRRYLKNKLPVP